MLDADAVINNSSQKVGGSNAFPDPARKTVGGSGPRKTSSTPLKIIVNRKYRETEIYFRNDNFKLKLFFLK